jgi:hypothetical protein
MLRRWRRFLHVTHFGQAIGGIVELFHLYLFVMYDSYAVINC